MPRLSAKFLVVFCVFAFPVIALPIYNRRRPTLAAAHITTSACRELSNRQGWDLNEVEVEPGVMLRGLVYRPARSGRPWILFFGGNSRQQLRESQMFLEGLLGSGDYGLATWAYRGFDCSSGSTTAKSIRSDALVLYHHLESDIVDIGAPVHLVGFSFGADIALRLAIDLSITSHSATSLTLLSPSARGYCIKKRAWYSHWSVWCDYFNPADQLERLKGPVLVVHGSADLQNPVATARNLARKLGERGNYMELPKSGHEAALSDVSVRQAILKLVADHSS